MSLQISEAKIAIFNISPGNIVLLDYISAIIGFDVKVQSGYLRSMFHLWRNRVVDFHLKICKKQVWKSDVLKLQQEITEKWCFEKHCSCD